MGKTRRWIPTLIFLLSASAVMGLWSLDRSAQEERVRVAVDQATRQLASRFEHFVEHRMNALERLGASLATTAVLQPGDFERRAQRVIDRYPGFQAVNWVEESGVIRWTVPREGNESARGRDLRRNRFAAAVIARAAETRRLAMTRSLELYQGGTGFAVYIPVERFGRIVGFVNGVFRIEDLMAASLGDEGDPSFSYRLRDGEKIPFELVGAGEFNWDGGGVEHLDGYFAGWRIEAGAPVETATMKYGLFALGLAFSVMLALAVRLALRREERALDTEARFQQLVSSAREGVLVADHLGRATFVNRRICELLGHSEEDLLGRRLDDIIEESLELPAADLLAIDEDDRGERDYQHRRPDGSVVWLRISATPVRTREDGPQGELVLISDISQRRRLEAELLQNRKMDALGRLSGGIAHDFNNMLTAILSGSELALMDLDAKEDPRGHIRGVMDSAERAARLTSRLLTFGRQQVTDPVESDLNELVDDVRSMCEKAVDRAKVKIEIEFATESVPVRVDRDRFDQVVLNLVVNAADAMPEGGRILVRTARMRVDQLTRVGRRIVDPGDYALLEIIDEGPGVAEEIADLVFEPFFTTKEIGSGTGLGLATVHGVVAQAGGVVTLENAEKTGAVFRVYLPLVS